MLLSNTNKYFFITTVSCNQSYLTITWTYHFFPIIMAKCVYVWGILALMILLSSLTLCLILVILKIQENMKCSSFNGLQQMVDGDFEIFHYEKTEWLDTWHNITWNNSTCILIWECKQNHSKLPSVPYSTLQDQ